MPKQAASVFQQFTAIAEGYGIQIGAFTQTGKTFERLDTILRIDDDDAIVYEVFTGIGRERVAGRAYLKQIVHCYHLAHTLQEQHKSQIAA